MKNKTTILFLTSLLMNYFTSELFSQTFLNHDEIVEIPFLKPAPTDLAMANQKEDVIGWYNYGKEIREVHGNTDYLSYFIFPDSTVLGQFSTNYQYIKSHSIGQVFDPTCRNYGLDNKPLPKSVDYTVDSVRFKYSYRRPQKDVSDTLLIQFYKQAGLRHGFSVTQNRDTIDYFIPSYDSSANAGKHPFKEVKFLLEEKHNTDVYAKTLTIPVLMDINKGEKFAVTVSYIPGNPYAKDDALNYTPNSPQKKINAFLMFIYKDKSKIDDLDAFNGQLIIHSDVRYGFNKHGFNGYYLPGNIFNSAHYHTDISFHVTAENVPLGVEENEKMISTIYPNPTLDVVHMTFDEPIDNMKLSLIDMSGRIVHQERMPQGNFQHSIDVSQMAPGTYALKLISDAHVESHMINVAR